MAVSIELSSEIAAALLANPNRRSSRELETLREIIFRVHSILAQMDERARADRIRAVTRKELSAE